MLLNIILFGERIIILDGGQNYKTYVDKNSIFRRKVELPYKHALSDENDVVHHRQTSQDYIFVH
jgi:hypothetical protein